jgi:hypothetical protein
MLRRSRLAMQAGGFDKIDGIAEVDETFIGGKARNMHAVDRRRGVAARRGRPCGTPTSPACWETTAS